MAAIVKIITAPAGNPVTLVEAKLQCRVTTPDLDTLFINLIAEATGDAESETSRALYTQTLELQLDYWPNDAHLPAAERYAIVVPRPPVQSITSVKYINAAGTEITLVENTDYIVQIADPRTRIAPKEGTVWPATIARPGCIRVRYVAGYGTETANNPDFHALRGGIFMRIASKFRNPSDEISGATVSKYDLGSSRVFQRYAVGHFGYEFSEN